ncbi:MAG: T9SS type A sorting domain-containing protein [Ignavibacteriota bacterium]
MKKVIVLFVVIASLSSALLNAQSGWFVQKTTFTGNPTSMFFIDSNTGWIMHDSGRVIRTTNGGNSWSPAYFIGTYYPISSMKFVNDLTGWAAGGFAEYNPFNMEYAIVLKTTNGGVNWTTQYLDSWGPHINCLAIADANNVFTTASGTDMYSMGSNGRVVKTSNGGLNWNSDSPVSGWASTSVCFFNSQTGWVSAYGQSDVPPTRRLIYRTTNAGASWIQVYRDSINTFSPIISRIHFPDANTGYKFLGGTMKKSTNGGSNWTALDSVSTYGTGEMFFVSSDTGWIIKGSIKRTNNGGQNWTVQNSPAASGKLFFVNSNTGWALGNKILMKTTNGGVEDADYASYFPMHTGNVYLYSAWNWPNPNSSWYITARITKDTVMNSHKYFYLTNFPDIGTGWVRYDSVRENLLYYFPNSNCSGYTNDKVIDSLSARVNDQVNSCVYHWSYTRVEDTTNQLLFNNYNVKTKSFRHDGIVLAHTRYAKNFGIKNYDAGEPPPSTYFVSLAGCYINGIMYGDTLLTNVSKISTEVPSSYSLGQNYPNPFNPITNVKFSIVKAGDVKVVVYYVQGREVQTLVNERLNAGMYEVKFDGSSLNSGVYFYRLTTDGFSDTKKMILIK